MAVTHTTVATNPESPLLDEGDWNAAHTVANGSFVAAKLSATVTDVVFGRSTAAAGNGEEIKARLRTPQNALIICECNSPPSGTSNLTWDTFYDNEANTVSGGGLTTLLTAIGLIKDGGSQFFTVDAGQAGLYSFALTVRSVAGPTTNKCALALKGGVFGWAGWGGSTVNIPAGSATLRTSVGFTDALEAGDTCGLLAQVATVAETDVSKAWLAIVRIR